MKMTAKMLAGLMGLLFAMAAQATVVEGRLELLWGDPAHGRGDAQFHATLVTDAGQRFALDPEQALRAADDLYALASRRVAVDFSPVSKGALPYGIEAIVAADASKAKAANTKVLGTTVWVTLMCKFSDSATEQKPLSFFQSQYGNTPGQLDHYWREVSYNKINLTGSSAHGWFVLPHPRSFYVTGTAPNEDANLNQLFDDCTTAANASVNFAAGGGVQGINMMFNGDLDGYAWGGGRCTTLDGVNKCWSTTWNPPWSFGNLAPLSHEMGHGYGLPHANNSDGDADPYDNPWDVMSDAWSNAVQNATYGAIAKHINVYHRTLLGWMDIPRRRVIAAGTQVSGIQLDRASLIGSTHTQMIQVFVPGEPSSHHYTIEARKRFGNYDANLAGDAVIIHQVNPSRATPAQSMDADVPPANRANNQGSMFKVGEVWTAPGNTFRVRVSSATANGFVVAVCGPRGAQARQGWPRFDNCDVVQGPGHGVDRTPGFPPNPNPVPRTVVKP